MVLFEYFIYFCNILLYEVTSNFFINQNILI